MIKVVYQGQDITGGVSINRCVHEMFADGESDVLNITLNDTDRIWDSWGPKRGDTIAVEYGPCRTGKLFVYSAVPQNGLFSIAAYAMPPTAMEAHNKAWEQVKFLQLAQEIAGRHGLALKQYGVTDVLYSYVMQAGQPDFKFFQERCALEGCSFLVYDGSLILYSQAYIEGQGAAETVEVTRENQYQYQDNRGRLYGSCQVTVGRYSGSFSPGNGAARVLSPNVSAHVGSNGEAQRFARGLLRQANRSAQTGVLYTKILPGLAAGSMVSLQTHGAQSWDGPAFIYRIRNNYAQGKSKVFFRRPLEGY